MTHTRIEPNITTSNGNSSIRQSGSASMPHLTIVIPQNSQADIVIQSPEDKQPSPQRSSFASISMLLQEEASYERSIANQNTESNCSLHLTSYDYSQQPQSPLSVQSTSRDPEDHGGDIDFSQLSVGDSFDENSDLVRSPTPYRASQSSSSRERAFRYNIAMQIQQQELDSPNSDYVSDCDDDHRRSPSTSLP